ncbi:DoxX family membrane protein [Nocardioides gilvus]|uniref:DoxX family membrane protein n=1 Tax=Nocardioides gilvus TaxID=1735589 RepID=UPI000D741A6D|nr:DoxX family membrane protein [Nocardioides gilvus]
MAISRRVARPLLSSAFLVGSIQVLRDPRPAAEEIRPHVDRLVAVAQSAGLPLPQDPTVLARIAAAVQLSAAGALALGKAPRLSAAVLGATLAPTLLASRRSGGGSGAGGIDVAHAARSASLVGGLLLASVDTEGRPGLAWRARRAASDVRREAKHLTKEATLEAKLAAKSLG